ncbi:MAG: hypothetical protein KH366_15725 [Clostridiaceae bacterium]|nr:hypothetical protein [Clostridiaceae bacterium]
MQLEKTSISKSFYDNAAASLLTIRDAVAYLEKEVKTRTLREKLEKFGDGRDLQKVLVEGLLENDPARKKDSVERRVRGWLSNGNDRSIDKQAAIEVCFILKLSIGEADQLVTMVSEEALHYRNPDEIVYIFALQHGMTYPEAVRLNDQMKETLSKIKDSSELSENSFTPIIRSEVSAIQTKEELADYLEDSVGRLGRYHNNAYQEFMSRLELLESPRMDEAELRGGGFDDEHLTMRDILREYLFEKNVIYAMERAGKRTEKKKGRDREQELTEEKLVFTKVQENISKSWPDESTLSKMKSRKIDVTRRVLILLFIATDQGKDWGRETGELEKAYKDEVGHDYYVYDDWDDELTEDEVFEDIYTRLNDMLSLCGFATLDPRSPFDWLILYCICVDDIFDIDIRMRGIFKEMFGERMEE